MRLKIKEALIALEDKGIKVKKIDIAVKLWPEANTLTQRVSMTNLCSGKTQRIKPEWVKILCEELNCTPEFLLADK